MRFQAYYDSFMKGFRAGVAGKGKPKTQRMGLMYLKGWEAAQDALKMASERGTRIANEQLRQFPEYQ